MAKKLRIGMVVGEVSGDTLGAELIRAFQALGIDAEFEGIGGPQMQALGFNSFYPMETLSVMGLVEVLKHLKSLFAVRDGLLAKWRTQPVDVFIGIDAPDFNLRVSKAIKAEQLPIKTVQYVSPSVWAWRQGRVHGIKRCIDLVLCLFPFEKEFYTRFNVPAAFVGHPLAKQMPLQNPLLDAKLALGLDPSTCYVALLPGSRGGEVERLLPLLLQSAAKLSARHPHLEFLIPAINAARLAQIQAGVAACDTALQQRIHLFDHTQAEGKIGRMVMNAADVVALASGTATLEAMLLHRPMVTFYKLNALTYWIVKLLVKIPYYALPNIIAGRKVIEELIQQDATVDNLSAEIERLLQPTVAAEQNAIHLSLHAQLISGQTENPAQAILNLIQTQY